MSPNGDKQLTDVNEENVYVIGGLVDESVKKVKYVLKKFDLLLF